MDRRGSAARSPLVQLPPSPSREPAVPERLHAPPEPFRSVELALPDDEHVEPQPPECSDLPPITLLVLSQFVQPKAPVRHRNLASPAARVPMPEAAMNEDGLVAVLISDVRVPGKTVDVEPITSPDFSEDSSLD